jgi:tetratricopeptide (TPR) repeat protein
VVGLRCVERFEARGAWNVHETTRIALRESLYAGAPERMAVLSVRAMAACGQDTLGDRIERVYHQVLAEPAACYEPLRALDFDVRARPEDGSALAQALTEYAVHPGWPGLTRAWSLLVRSIQLQPYRRVEETIADLEAAVGLLGHLDQPAALAWVELALGENLMTRGHSGDLAAARVNYQRALDLRERLLAANPDSALAARDVSVSLDRLGDFFAGRGQSGDAAQALVYYQQGLEIDERLLAANPESAQVARNVSVSLAKLGGFLSGHGLPGDAALALAHYQRGLEIRERLLAANPDSAQAARDVAVNLHQLGDVLSGRGLPGDAAQALAHYQRGLEMSERLLAANPDSAQAARDLMVSYERMGKIMAGSKDADAPARALDHQRKALEIAMRLYDQNRGSMYQARTVAVSYLLTAQCAHAAANAELATQALAGCHGVLQQAIEAGITFDQPIMQLYQQLQAGR